MMSSVRERVASLAGYTTIHFLDNGQCLNHLVPLFEFLDGNKNEEFFKESTSILLVVGFIAMINDLTQSKVATRKTSGESAAALLYFKSSFPPDSMYRLDEFAKRYYFPSQFEEDGNDAVWNDANQVVFRLFPDLAAKYGFGGR